jgi:hypothetical protein
MNQVFWALGFISLGMAVSEIYHRAMWRMYREGLANGKPPQHQPGTYRYGGRNS